jgi:DhnA family fructose-bisphosphate aldolase class Ia
MPRARRFGPFEPSAGGRFPPAAPSGGERGTRTDPPRSVPPLLVLAADHRGRGVMTIENYAQYLEALTAALAHCDGVLATVQPLADLVRTGAVESRHRTYLSLNRSGLAGSVFELDDRLVASVDRAAADGYSGIKLMTRIDYSDSHTSAALELLGAVLERAREVGLEALIESVLWRDGAMATDTDAVVLGAVIAHDLGAPLLKVPIPQEPAGLERAEAVARVVQSVGVPVLFLGGPHREADGAMLDEATDVMQGGGAGLAVGRAIYQHRAPGEMAKQLADIVHAR